MCYGEFDPALLIPQHHVDSGNRRLIWKCFHGRGMRNGGCGGCEKMECLWSYIIGPHGPRNIPKLPTMADGFYICNDIMFTHMGLPSNVSIGLDSRQFSHSARHCSRSRA